MPVNLPLPERSALSPVAGVQLGIAEAGIKKANRKDVLVITLGLVLRWPVYLRKTDFVLPPCSSAEPI